MFQGYYDEKIEPGHEHSDQKPLIAKSARQPPPPQQATQKPSDRFTKVAENYLQWLMAPSFHAENLYSMMSKITDSNKREARVELIKVIRQLCPDMKVDKENSDLGWNEKTNTVFLSLCLNGKHTGYHSLTRC
jgi:hypothetical protein